LTARRSEFGEFAALLIVALGLAWINRFVQDDAFICFTYARSLVEGGGLTWFGDPVEGYTNFLWVLWLAVGFLADIDPIDAATVGGLVSYVVMLGAFWRLARAVIPSLFVRTMMGVVLVTNFSVSSYATGGLETMAVTAMFVVALWLSHSFRSAAAPARTTALLISITCGLGVLMRTDTASLFGLVMLSLAPWARHRPTLAFVGPAGLLVGGWLAWKFVTYGALLPNPYHVKTGGGAEAWGAGVRYLWRFLDAYWIWPCLVGVVLLRAIRRSPLPREEPHVVATRRLLTWTVAVWALYLVWVGGDFMEFRLVVIAFPAAVLLFGWGLHRCLPRARGRAVVTALVTLVMVGASVRHARDFRGITDDKTLDSIDTLASCYGLYPDGDWSVVGAALGEQLKGSDVVIATSASGAVPFYSRVCSVDMVGLTHREIARHGNRAGPDYLRPGHRNAATWEQLSAADVNLIVGHPTVSPTGVLDRPGSDAFCAHLVEGVSFLQRRPLGDCLIVSMPVDQERSLFMVYFEPHPFVDARLRSGAWGQRAYVARGRHLRTVDPK